MLIIKYKFILKIQLNFIKNIKTDLKKKAKKKYKKLKKVKKNFALHKKIKLKIKKAFNNSYLTICNTQTTRIFMG